MDLFNSIFLMDSILCFLCVFFHYSIHCVHGNDLVCITLKIIIMKRTSVNFETSSRKQCKVDQYYFDGVLLIPFVTNRSTNTTNKFNSEANSDILITVWGAPTTLHLHMNILERTKSHLLELLKESTDSRAYVFTQEIVTIIYDKDAADAWKFIWLYFALQYDIILFTVECVEETVLSITERNKISVEEIMMLFLCCDYLCDTTTRDLLLQQLVRDDILEVLPHTIVSNELLSAWCFTVVKLELVNNCLFFRQFLLNLLTHTQCNLPYMLPYILALRRVQVGKQYFSMYWETSVEALLDYESKLHRVGTVGRYNDTYNQELCDISVILDDSIWKRLQESSNFTFYEDCKDAIVSRTKLPITAASYLRNRKYSTTYRSDESKVLLKDFENMSNPLDIGLRRLHHYWNFVFPDLSPQLTSQLMLSGSIIPMCLLTFSTPSFEYVASTLFHSSDMDVYIVGDQPRDTEKCVIEYLSNTHEHVYEESRKSRDHLPSYTRLTVVTMVLAKHPIFPQTSLRVQLLYYESMNDIALHVTANQIVVSHHMCPVRAYYNPSTLQVIAMPSALYSWSSGYIRSYRIAMGEKPSIQHLYKYIRRRFGILTQQNSTLNTLAEKFISQQRPFASEFRIKNGEAHFPLDTTNATFVSYEYARTCSEHCDSSMPMLWLNGKDACDKLY